MEVERREPPKIELYPEPHQKITNGQSVLFQCRIMQGIPNPTLTWTRTDGRPMARNVEILEGGVIRYEFRELGNERGLSKKLFSFFFRMNQVTGEERGEYKCVAENIAGRTEMIATLTIQEVPEITLTPSGSFQVKVGEPLEISCMAKGQPKPRVSWEKMDPGAASAYM